MVPRMKDGWDEEFEYYFGRSECLKTALATVASTTFFVFHINSPTLGQTKQETHTKCKEDFLTTLHGNFVCMYKN